jgi:hypothetical protein
MRIRFRIRGSPSPDETMFFFSSIFDSKFSKNLSIERFRDFIAFLKATILLVQEGYGTLFSPDLLYGYHSVFNHSLYMRKISRRFFCENKIAKRPRETIILLGNSKNK